MHGEEGGADGLRGRLTKQGEDALGRVAQELLENPLINSAIARAFEARERAAQAQEMAFGALNIPSAADVERLTRRVRSVSQRLEGIEDGVDRVDERLAAQGPVGEDADRLAGIEARLPALPEDTAALRSATPPPRKRAPAKKKNAPEPGGEAEPQKNAPEPAGEAEPQKNAPEPAGEAEPQKNAPEPAGEAEPPATAPSS